MTTDTSKNPYKWIQKELETLDPYVDYENIYRLVTCYGTNDFINNLIYTLIFPNFVVWEWGARVVWREDGGKVFGSATARVEETQTKNDTWWWHGPSDPRTQKSVEIINQRHAYWNKRYPGDFAHNEDYVYTLAFSAVFMHRLRLRPGLSGVPEKVKIANYLFMTDMGKLFYSLTPDGSHVPLKDWPVDFDGLIAYCEIVENADKPGSDQGHMIASAIYEHFAFRWFSPPFRWLGRAISKSLSLPSTLATHRIQPPNPILKWLILTVSGWLLWLMEMFGPDPTVAFLPEWEQMPKDKMAERKKEQNGIDRRFSEYFAAMPQNQGMGCPFQMTMKMKN
ncbi:Uu.00g124100.m01.CDS01 [Anthostomella pinea]|uniref:Uu.00g124100.m01.CDS01 n=1 Tax=Anthostomella pinea TaxID=933095 RepID=A0AAI8VI26_9PEZI|nr:Uu.00g124100.m01.CDS01 [Anthostomella pinea]